VTFGGIARKMSREDEGRPLSCLRAPKRTVNVAEGFWREWEQSDRDAHRLKVVS
jgi:hypothetical protein